MTDPATATATLKARTFSAAQWSLAGHVGSQGLRLLSNLVMARLLVPEMFGVMAIATMVTVIANSLSDLGIDQKIIQSRRGDDPAFLDTAWVVQIFRGVGLWMLVLALSGLMHFANEFSLFPPGSVYALSDLPVILAAASSSILILSFRSTRIATAYREFRQRQLVSMELLSQIAAMLVMIPVAWVTHSIWALVLGGIVAALTTTVLSHSWLRGHRNMFRMERHAATELATFGKAVLLSSAVGVMAINGDRLLLGAWVTPEVLGLYAIATLIVSAIASAMGRLLSSASLPAFSEVVRTDEARLRNAYFKFRLYGDAVLLTAAGCLFASGQTLIDALYDARYADAGRMLEILALSLLVVRYSVAHQVYLAVGKPRNLVVINVAKFVSLCALVPWFYYTGGTEAALWAIALHALVTMPLVHAFNTRLGLRDLRLELLVLPALGIGYLFGMFLNALAHWITRLT
jgi:O-antigen/teichoic acid export membrane protein